MEPLMMEIGDMVWLREMVDLHIVMAICMKGSGVTIKQMGMEFIRMQREHTTKVTSRMTCSMARALKYGMRGLSTKGSTSMARRRARASTHGLMAHSMRGSGWTTRSMGLECISRKTGNGTMGSG